MTPPQDFHQEWSQQLNAYARDELEPETSRALEAHLRSCGGCRSELAAVQALLAGIEAPLSPEERERLHAALALGGHEAAPVVPFSPRPSLERPWVRRLAPALGAAALLLIGGVAVMQGLLGSGSAGGGPGGDAGGAEGAASEAAAPSASQLSRAERPAWLGNLGPTSLDEVARLARSQPTLQAVRKAARTEEAATAGQEGPEDVLVPQAPDELRNSVRSCIGEISEQFEQANPLPVVGAQGRLDGKRVLFVGFITSSSDRRRDQLTVWALQPGSCAPLGYQASRLSGGR